jgi:hypothetical protein
MRLAWIRKHWEPKFIANVEAKIKATVRQASANNITT